jgi:hypothetical protein
VSIPKVWAEYVLRDVQMESRWNDLMREKGYHAAQLPIPPWHRRARRLARNSVFNLREWGAKKLAPWAIRDEDW